ncbi:MAG: phosphate ABC transporter substrate-binding protein [Armatimonadota bacterium]|jgi:phosphate transport system substrate-binding protein
MKTSRFGLSLLLLAFVVASVALIGCPSQPETDDMAPPIDEIEPVDGAAAEAGTIEIIGSTTSLPVATAWAHAFHEKNPSVEINVSGGGSGNGIKAVIDGTTDIGNSSREIKESEIELAQRNNVNPVEHIIAYDGLAPIVHPDNPAGALSVQQLSEIYSGEVTKWSEVGVTGMANDNIVVVSRDSASGTYESWKELVIQMRGADEDRDYAPAALKKNSNRDVRQTVADTPSAIGYIGLGYVDDSVKVVPVIPLEGGEAILATSENVQNGSFPVARALYMYTNGEPTGIVADFLEWGKGAEGQALVAEEGFVPIE